MWSKRPKKRTLLRNKSRTLRMMTRLSPSVVVRMFPPPFGLKYQFVGGDFVQNKLLKVI